MQTRTENNGTPTRTANSAKVERFLKKIDDLQFIEETRRSAEHIPAPGVGYWRAVDEMLVTAGDAFANATAGGVPIELHGLALAVTKFARERELFEQSMIRLERTPGGGSRERQYPTTAFLELLEGLFDARRKLDGPPEEPPRMESIATLVEQKVSRPQIANMFGITVNEVWQEIEKPGSVIGRPGYVHPSDRQREEQRMDELAEMDDFLPLAAASAKARIDRQERAAEREGHGQALRDGQSNRSARSLAEVS